MRVRFAALLLVAACGKTAAVNLDSGAGVDSAARPDGNAAADAPLDAGAYSHTITLDGSDDFAPGEDFPTTTPGYGARIAWDANNIYVGYSGTDLSTSAPNASTKWLFMYVDADPGNGTGAGSSQTYNTQRATMPPGFGAELYLRWKCDGTLASIEQYDAGTQTWSPAATPQYAQNGTFVELAFPRTLLGNATEVGLVTYMINEGNLIESSYAGLYASNFTDGYAADLMLTRYLRADFTASREPNDPDNEAPPGGAGSDGGT